MPADPSLATSRNPAVELAVAVWLGMPDDKIRRGLDEGWIRGPQPPAPSTALALQESEPQPDAPLVDRARVHALLQRLDRTLDQTTFDTAWNEAGADDVSRADRLTGFVASALGFHAEAVPGIDVLEALADTMGGEASFVRLGGQSGAALEVVARTDAGMRLALAQHSPWALTGDRVLAARADPHGRMDRFDPGTGETLISDAWIGDRARHAAWRDARAEGRSLHVDGASWRFVDRADDTASLELKGDDGAPVHQVVFARDSGDAVAGGATTDRIHGGDGDDVLRGRAGDDLVEGGRGADFLQGGSGRDELSGQQGDDELDGGAGEDRLDGGSGVDKLTGGRGNDVLRGGAGADRYAFDPGDGVDTIQDADGGDLIIDEVLLSGTVQRHGNGWVSDDGSFTIGLEGSLASGGTLVVRRSSAETDAIRIEGWRQGSFGLTLAGDDDDENDDSSANASARDAWHTEGGDEATVPAFGTEGANGDSDADAALATLDADLAAFEDEPAKAPGLVDLEGVAQALSAWGIPAPPDVGAAQLVDARPLTEVTLADAIAGENAAFTDDGSGASAPLGDWTLPPLLPTLTDLPVPIPPTLALRAS